MPVSLDSREQQWIRKANVGRIGFGRKRLAKALVALMFRCHRAGAAPAVKQWGGQASEASKNGGLGLTPR